MSLHAEGFSDAERRAVYRAIYERRDVRGEFVADPVPDDVLARVLDAAHHAPSVGFMQPTRFIVVRDPERKARVHAAFSRANEAAAQGYVGAERAAYASLKLAGILQAPLNVCVVCEIDSARGRGLGRRTMPETALYSSVCAVQNLWLAARAEGVGIGWVSIFEPQAVCEILEIPPEFALVAYLCVGFVREFARVPDLERAGWEARANGVDVVYAERFGARVAPG